jgi:hypothetical protein
MWAAYGGSGALTPALLRCIAHLEWQAISFLHLLAWGTWFGSMMYTTFVVGIVMFKTLPRQTFRDVQARCAALASKPSACLHARARVALARTRCARARARVAPSQQHPPGMTPR